MNQKKDYSITRKAMIAFAIGIVVIIAGLITFIGYSIHSSKVRMNESAQASLKVLTDDLERDIEEQNEFITNIYLDNSDFAALARGQLTAGGRVVSVYELQQEMGREVASSGALLLFTADDEVSVFQLSSSIDSASFKENSARCHRIMDFCRTLDRDRLFSWITYRDDDGIMYLLNTYRKNDAFICSVISLENTLRLNGFDSGDGDGYLPVFFDDEQMYAIDSKSGNANVSLEELIRAEARGEKVSASNIWEDNQIIQTRAVSSTPIRLAFVLPASYFNKYNKISIAVVSAILLILLIFYVTVFRMLTKMLFYPLNRISELSRQIEESSAETITMGLSSQSNIVEFNQINSALINLTNQTVLLTSEKEKIERDEVKAELQYYQLQTRTHFILNCLKSLYGMLETKQYTKMQRMIIAFSNHIRYVFHDSASFVPLSAELDEVMDYYNIIQLDSSSPILLIRDVAEDTMDIQVPPLVVQTFVENSIKHNKKDLKPLQIVIQTEFAEMDGSNYLKIKITDNGTGYDEIALGQLNRKASATYEQYHVGISNLKRRMQLLYQEECMISFFNGQNGGAMVLIYLPIRRLESEE